MTWQCQQLTAAAEGPQASLQAPLLRHYGRGHHVAWRSLQASSPGSPEHPGGLLPTVVVLHQLLHNRAVGLVLHSEPGGGRIAAIGVFEAVCEGAHQSGGEGTYGVVVLQKQNTRRVGAGRLGGGREWRGGGRAGRERCGSAGQGQRGLGC